MKNSTPTSQSTPQPQPSKSGPTIIKLIGFIGVPIILTFVGLWLFLWNGPSSIDFAKMQDKMAFISESNSKLNDALRSKSSATYEEGDVSKQLDAISGYIAANKALEGDRALKDKGIAGAYESYKKAYEAHKNKLEVYSKELPTAATIAKGCSISSLPSGGFGSDPSMIGEKIDSYFSPCLDAAKKISQSSGISAAADKVTKVYIASIEKIKSAGKKIEQAYSSRDSAGLAAIKSDLRDATNELSDASSEYGKSLGFKKPTDLNETFYALNKALFEKVNKK